jgi:hypothetical protein
MSKEFLNNTTFFKMLCSIKQKSFPVLSAPAVQHTTNATAKIKVLKIMTDHSLCED